MKRINWINIVNEALALKARDGWVIYEGSYYKFAIFGIKEKMMGFMILWEESCKRAINISRMELSTDVEFYSMTSEDDYNRLIPKDLLFENVG